MLEGTVPAGVVPSADDAAGDTWLADIPRSWASLWLGDKGTVFEM